MFGNLFTKVVNMPEKRFIVMESIKTGPKQFYERRVGRPYYNSLPTAKAAATRAEKPDNQPFVMDSTHMIVHTGKKGKDYE